MEKTKKKKYIPSSFLIIIFLMIIFIIISWILKSSDVSTSIYEKNNDGIFIEKKNTPINGLGILDIFTSIWHGFVSKSEIILFLFSLSGLLAIVVKTKSLDIAIEKIIKKLKGKEILLIPVLMIFFGLGGTSFGLWEETLAFFPILIPVFIRMGYGVFPAVLTILLGAGTGVLASTINPFAVSVAFDAANGVKGSSKEVATSTMLGARWISFIIFEAIAIAFVLFITLKIKKGKLKIVGINQERIDKKFPYYNSKEEFNWKKKLTITIFVLSFIVMILSLLPWKDWLGSSLINESNENWEKKGFWLASQSGGWGQWGDWWFISISALFLLASFVIFMINKSSFIDDHLNKEQIYIKTYMDGAKDVLSVCMLIAVAAGFGFLLEKSNIGPLIANSTKNLSSLGIIGYGAIMFIVSLILSCAIPSTSGFAAAFMPIFGGIVFKAFPAELQSAAIAITVMGFIFGSGIANLITPTSAALMAYTNYAEIPYSLWIKKIYPIIIIFIITSLYIITYIGLLANYGIVF